MDLAVKMSISSMLLLFALIQHGESLPQLSIPFVPWNENKKEPSFLNVRVPNPFSFSFGKNRDDYNNFGNKEDVNQNEKIVIVTPSANYYTNNYNDLATAITETTRNSKVWGVNIRENHVEKVRKDKPNLENITTKDNQDKQVIKFNSNDVNSLQTITDYDLTTTESTTEYESTTFDDSDLYRSGLSGHVVASLLG